MHLCKKTGRSLKMTWNWNKFFSWLKKASLAILIAFLKFLRDIGRSWWKPIRRRIVKWSYVWLPLLIMVVLSYTDKALFEQLARTAIMVAGFGVILYGIRPKIFKKKKKKR